ARPLPTGVIGWFPRVRVAGKFYRGGLAGGFEGERRRAALRLAIGFVRLLRRLAPLRAVLRGELDQTFRRIARDAHARRVVFPRMGLDQHGEAVSRRPVRGRKSRRPD